MTWCAGSSLRWVTRRQLIFSLRRFPSIGSELAISLKMFGLLFLFAVCHGFVLTLSILLNLCLFVFCFLFCLQLNFWFVPTLYFVEPFSVCLLVLFTNELHQLKVDVGMLTPRRFIELTFRALALRQSFFALTKG